MTVMGLAGIFFGLMTQGPQAWFITYTSGPAIPAHATAESQTFSSAESLSISWVQERVFPEIQDVQSRLLRAFGDVRNAIAREKQLKRWRRGKKVFLVERANASWRDLGEDFNR